MQHYSVLEPDTKKTADLFSTIASWTGYKKPLTYSAL